MAAAQLKARVEALMDRAADARRRIEQSSEWLARNGAGTYGPRTTGRSLDGRRTRPIRSEYFKRIVGAGRCLGCATGKLALHRNPRGGTYYSCSRDGHSCYYIGMNGGRGVGYELIVITVKEAG